ncbi:MAG: DUF2269 domain-containing protein [Candidatus Thiodiazotropha sp. (ex Codakia rugifera)]|nr:DUF2269 domain-containing protein [Candidatus Thiodiazotropha sp. (ex Codakia rugifera)]
MDYSILKYFHILGAVLMGAGLVGVWLADLRSRQHRDLVRFSEAVRYIAVFYDGVVVPGALVLLTSGTWFIIQYYGGWDFLKLSWLTGMIGLFLFEFIEGNTITRLYFMKLRRITQNALDKGKITAELERERAKLVPTFTHYLDLPMLFLIIALGALKPTTWTTFFYGAVISIAVATLLTVVVPRIYPWGEAQND